MLFRIMLHFCCYYKLHSGTLLALYLLHCICVCRKDSWVAKVSGGSGGATGKFQVSKWSASEMK